MRKIVAITQITLDGMQSPAGSKDDTKIGSPQRGWVIFYVDDTGNQVINETILGVRYALGKTDL